MLWSCCVSMSLSLGNPPAFASGLGVWQVKPCCDTGAANLLLLFCTQSKDSKLIHALFSGFTASEVLLCLSRLHLMPLSGPEAFSHLPGPYKGFNIMHRGVHTALLWPLWGCSRLEKGRRGLLNSSFCRISLAQSMLRACESSRALVSGVSGSSQLCVCVSVCLSSTAPGGTAEGVDIAENL